MKSRKAICDVMISWLGAEQGSAMHQHILSIYNTQKNLPRGYKMRINDAWCAATVSAAALSVGYEDIIPCECSCTKMIEKLKALDSWIENDAFVPSPGDLIFYDWEDDGKGDCIGQPNHVGVVISVEDNRINVIEGNKGTPGRVAYRNVSVGSRYIRGFGVPMYDDEHIIPDAKPTELYYEVQPGDYLIKIGKRFDCDWMDIARLNNLHFPYIIHKGERLRIK